MADEFASRVEETAAMLERAALERGIYVSGDGRVAEIDAAELIGMSGEYLKQLRASGCGPVAYRVPVRGHRVSYKLRDISAYIEAQREITGDNALDACARGGA